MYHPDTIPVDGLGVVPFLDRGRNEFQLYDMSATISREEEERERERERERRRRRIRRRRLFWIENDELCLY
jgi:hypothetical protein